MVSRDEQEGFVKPRSPPLFLECFAARNSRREQQKIFKWGIGILGASAIPILVTNHESILSVLSSGGYTQYFFKSAEIALMIVNGLSSFIATFYALIESDPMLWKILRSKVD